MAENRFPSMTALLGLLAVAGFQNRDKIADLLRQATGGSAGDETVTKQDDPAASSPAAPPNPRLGGLLAGHRDQDLVLDDENEAGCPAGRPPIWPSGRAHARLSFQGEGQLHAATLGLVF